MKKRFYQKRFKENKIKYPVTILDTLNRFMFYPANEFLHSRCNRLNNIRINFIGELSSILSKREKVLRDIEVENDSKRKEKKIAKLYLQNISLYYNLMKKDSLRDSEGIRIRLSESVFNVMNYLYLDGYYKNDQNNPRKSFLEEIDRIIFSSYLSPLYPIQINQNNEMFSYLHLLKKNKRIKNLVSLENNYYKAGESCFFEKNLSDYKLVDNKINLLFFILLVVAQYIRFENYFSNKNIDLFFCEDNNNQDKSKEYSKIFGKLEITKKNYLLFQEWMKGLILQPDKIYRKNRETYCELMPRISLYEIYEKLKNDNFFKSNEKKLFYLLYDESIEGLYHKDLLYYLWKLILDNLDYIEKIINENDDQFVFMFFDGFPLNERNQYKKLFDSYNKKSWILKRNNTMYDKNIYVLIAKKEHGGDDFYKSIVLGDKKNRVITITSEYFRNFIYYFKIVEKILYNTNFIK